MERIDRMESIVSSRDFDYSVRIKFLESCEKQFELTLANGSTARGTLVWVRCEHHHVRNRFTFAKEVLSPSPVCRVHCTLLLKFQYSISHTLSLCDSCRSCRTCTPSLAKKLPSRKKMVAVRKAGLAATFAAIAALPKQVNC